MSTFSQVFAVRPTQTVDKVSLDLITSSAGLAPEIGRASCRERV